MKLLTRIGGLFLLNILFSVSLMAQGVETITGSLSDEKTGDRLPYATVSLVKSLLGTVTNENGEFEFQIPNNIEKDTLIVRYLGYQDKRIPLSKVESPLEIKLASNAFTLGEVIIRPLPPTHYIKLAAIKLKENGPSSPFSTEGYFSEKVLENGDFIKHNEAVFETYYPSYQDTVKNQHKLVLFREEDKVREVAFMLKKREKERQKDIKRAKKAARKKGEEYVEKEEKDDLGGLFGGPEQILDIAKLDVEGGFLDSNNFSKIDYTFGKGTTYHGKKIMVINFKSRKKIDHVNLDGTVFIDEETDAIVALNFNGEVNIPGIIKPILFVMGYSIENPKIKVDIKYREIGDKWYPVNTRLYLNLNVTKRHMFSKNEKGNFDFDQVFIVNKFELENPLPIPKDKRFDAKKGYKENKIHNDKGLKWSEINIMKK